MHFFAWPRWDENDDKALEAILQKQHNLKCWISLPGDGRKWTMLPEKIILNYSSSLLFRKKKDSLKKNPVES